MAHQFLNYKLLQHLVMMRIGVGYDNDDVHAKHYRII